MALQKVLKGEKKNAPVRDVVDGDTLSKTHVTQHNTLGDVLTTWHFDFANVSRRELIVLAGRSLVISLRGRFKAAKVADAEKWDGRTINVREWLDTKRREKVSRADKAKALMGSATAEEKRAMLEMLRAALEDSEE